jgi:hypothetical protein
MSFVIAAPETMAAAATDLATIGSDLSAAHAAAVVPTVALVPAAGDEVSAVLARLFSRYAEGFQGLAGQATAFHENFAQHLTAGAHSYASAEALDVPYLRWLVENAGLYAAVRTLFEELQSNSLFFQLLSYILEPIRGLLGISLIVLFFAVAAIVESLINFLGNFGL